MNIKNCDFIKEVCDIAANMYRMGWNERNGGNITCLLQEAEVSKVIDVKAVKRTITLSRAFPGLANKYLVATGTGKRFKNFEKNPEENLGVLQISEDGTYAKLLWGFVGGGTVTSEITTHLATHEKRLEQDPTHKVVLHAHPVNIVAMTHIHSLLEEEFSKTLWKMCTECLVIFPEGVAVLPWMPSSNDEIGKVTAEKMKEFRTCIWALHGIVTTGNSLDEAFGLMETVEKAAEIYMKINDTERKNFITDEQLEQLATSFGLKERKEWPRENIY